MRFFDEEAMRGYLQILHGLIERLSEQSKNKSSKNTLDELGISENMEVKTGETRKDSSSLSENARPVWVAMF